MATQTALHRFLSHSINAVSAGQWMLRRIAPVASLCVALVPLLIAGRTTVLADDSSTSASQPVADAEPLELFNQRIMPIFRSPNPSSCVQCHLAAVDLKQYILPSHEATFASLRKQGLIDLERPSESKILELIGMGDRDADRQARLIHAKTRRAEYEAFAAWIEACCLDSQLLERTSSVDGEAAGPSKPDPVIRHARKSRLVESFVRNVWSQRMRCFPCHTPHEIDPNNPQHQKPAERQREMVKQYGRRVNIFLETPEATLQQMIVNSRKSTETHLPMFNLDDPRKSLLVLKPTSKLPPKNENGTFERASSVEPVAHMGGLKMHVDDQSYKSFVSWIQDYANVVGDRYQSVDDLPADNWYPTQIVLRMKDCPDSWPAKTPVQLFVYERNELEAAGSAEPIAFTQGTVTPRGIVNGALFLLQQPPNDAPADELPAGEYRIAIHVDKQGLLDKDPTLLLGEDTRVGQVHVKSDWPQGFRDATMISYSDAE